MDRTEAEAARTQDTALNLLMWEIRGTYGKQVGKYCESSNPPPLAEFFNLIRPSSTWGIPDDAELRNNGQACMGLYYDIHEILIEALSSIARDEDWFPGVWEAADHVDFGAEIRGGLISGGAGQFCPGILEATKQFQ